jgi:hypothetical protein
MAKLFATTFALCGALLLSLAGCKDAPGGDGQYATHDRGALNRHSP